MLNIKLDDDVISEKNKTITQQGHRNLFQPFFIKIEVLDI